MLTKTELENLLHNPDAESDRIEMTEGNPKNNMEKFREAICAFSNDLADTKKAGYLLIGVKKNGSLAGLKVTDELQKDIASIRYNGQILPQPTLHLAVFSFPTGDVLVIEVLPAPHPPVRYRGKVYIRVGASGGTATEAEERRLTEKRTAHARTFDALPCWEAEPSDLAEDLIQLSYFPLAIDRQILLENHRDLKQQLASLRLFDVKRAKPTHAGILLFGLNPSYFLSGAYIQYVKLRGKTRNNDDIEFTHKFEGALFDTLKEIDLFIKNIVQSRPVSLTDSFRDRTESNYPLYSLREFVMNAIMHRDYESNRPIYIYDFEDRIEIHNAGGLYGSVNITTFPDANDYRNPIIAEVMLQLRYVNRFNFGIRRAQTELQKNGNPLAEFKIQQDAFAVTVKIHPKWLNELFSSTTKEE